MKKYVINLRSKGGFVVISVSSLNAQAMIIMMNRQITPITAKKSNTYRIVLQIEGNLDLLTFEAKNTVGSGKDPVRAGDFSSFTSMIEKTDSFRILTSTEDLT